MGNIERGIQDFGNQATLAEFEYEHRQQRIGVRPAPVSLLIADVHPDTVKWSALSLTGQHLDAPETYDAAWWRARAGREESFNWRLLPYLIKKTVTRSEFWWGAASALLLGFLLRRLWQR